MPDVVFNYTLGANAGYRYNISKIGEHAYDELAYFIKENFPDVEVTRPGQTTDLSLLHTKCLTTVNGYVYPTAMFDGKLYIPKATTSMVKSRLNHIGIISFNNLPDELVKIPITVDMITPDTPIPLYEKVILTFERSIGSCFLVLGGYLVFEHPEFFYRVSDSSFALRLDRLNYIERLYETNRYRNIFNELSIPLSTLNPHMFDAEIARSAPVITRYLSCFNSFLVEVPATNLSVRKVYLEHSNVPGNFRTELEPKLPFVSGYGKLTEYMKCKNNDTKYTVTVNDAYYNNHLFTKMSTADTQVYNDHREPGRTYHLSESFFLEIKATI